MDAIAMIRRGTKIPLPDAVLAATAIHHGIPLWTRDAHFARVQAVAPGLILFDDSEA